MELLNAIIDILFHLKNISTHTTQVCKVETSHINYNDMPRGGGSESVLSISTDFKYVSYPKDSSVCRGFDNLLNK